MSQTLVQTKNRIKSVDSISKITKAMKLVSTVKFRQQMKKLEGARNFADTLEDILSYAFLRVDENFKSIYSQEFDSTKKFYILITSSLGLCGAYNYNLFKLTDDLFNENDDVIIIGSKGQSHYKKHRFNIIDVFGEYNDPSSPELIEKLANYISNIYPSGKYKEIDIVYTYYKNSISFNPKIQKVFPISRIEKEEKIREIEPILEPSPQEVIDMLVPFYISSIVGARLVEASVCEQASRRTAMENATDNAENLSKELELEYNKARQASITNDIIEVVSASNNVTGGQ